MAHMDVRLLVGQNVRRLRVAADLTQEGLAERMGVDRSYINALELGKRNPTIITLWRVAEAMDAEVEQLVAIKTTSSVKDNRS